MLAGYRTIRLGEVFLPGYDRGLLGRQGLRMTSRDIRFIVSGSGSKGSMSSMGLSGSSSGFSTGVGFWYISIEE